MYMCMYTHPLRLRRLSLNCLRNLFEIVRIFIAPAPTSPDSCTRIPHPWARNSEAIANQPRMDPLSVSYGILPMVGNSVNVYKSVRAKFKIFCHYSAEVERIRKLFGAQRDYFLNEIELVLRLVLQDQDIVKAMMKDPAHTEWHAHSLEKKLEALLERNLMSLIDIVNDINDSISTLQRAFKCFAPLEEEQKRVRRNKQAMAANATVNSSYSQG